MVQFPPDRVTAPAFLEALITAVPYKIHTALTDNGIQFRYPPRYTDGPTARYMTRMFDMRCRENGIEHRFTKINHPWTTDEVEQSLLRDLVPSSGCPWVTAWRRAGHEVKIRPRSLTHKSVNKATYGL